MEEELKELQILKDSVEGSHMPESIKEELYILLARVSRASKYGSYSIEYESAAKYIHWVTAIPWGSYSEDNLDLVHVKETLDKEHFSMDTVKERVLEYLAVMNLKKAKGEMPRTPILCFVGLQGIGKTSMAKSIAKALGRSFERISMGGMPSALELLGRSKANPDAEPGLIVKALIRSKTYNPVILLDEVEKSGNDLDSRSSVMASLLEILDPEQNVSFIDNYFDFPIDLSNTFFILTANNLGPLSNALLDRLEIIKLTGYTDEEKQTIAKEYILPRMYEQTGVSPDQLQFDQEVWPLIIRPLGYEAGIRELERTLLGVGRKAAKSLLQDPQAVIKINAENIKAYLNPLT